MRLTRSLVLWLAGTTALVLSAHGWMQLRQEREDLVAATRSQLVLLATAIRTGVESAVRDDQRLDIKTMLEQLELRDPAVDVFVFDEHEQLIASSWGSEPNIRRATELAQRAGEGLGVEEASEGLVAVAPIRGSESHIGKLVIIRPTGALNADLEQEGHSALISMAVLIVALSCVIWFVLRQRLLQPMSHLVAGIRRVASGDLSSRLDMTGRDEVAEIGREFDAMAAALEEAHRRLQSEVERHDQLEHDMQRANKMATIGELATMLAHEIGSPLQVLNGRARALAVRADLPEDARRSATVLVEQTDRVDRVVQRLLGLARRKASVFSDVDVRQPVKLVTELLAGEARRRGVRLELAADDVPVIRADADHVQQVILNLLQNALKACARGGAVHVEIRRSSFTVPASDAQQPSVAIAVRDSGEGIPEELRAHVFEPFFSSWGNGQRQSGTGLGLPVVRSIMLEHGGVVTVSESQPGGGACLTVHFPVAGAARRGGVREVA